jgi:hypothetical protein
VKRGHVAAAEGIVKAANDIDRCGQGGWHAPRYKWAFAS